jgi:hypothetical protein
MYQRLYVEAVNSKPLEFPIRLRLRPLRALGQDDVQRSLLRKEPHAFQLCLVLVFVSGQSNPNYDGGMPS